MPPPPADLDITSKPWEPAKHKAITFINASVVDPLYGVVLEGRTLRLADGKVSSLEKGDQDDWVSVEAAGDTVIDAQGLFIVPGLIDCHVHLVITPGSATMADIHKLSEATRLLRSTWVLKKHLSLGFTTVRDVGGACKAHAEATDEWLIPGPRVFQGGPIMSQTGGHGDTESEQTFSACCQGGAPGNSLATPMGLVVDGVEQARLGARYIMKHGANHIKICTTGGVASVTDKLDSLQFTVEEISAITDTVKKMGGTLVTAHCMTSEGIRHSIAGGVGGIEHGFFLDEPTAKLMAEKGVYLTPTLAVVEILSNPPFGTYLSPASREKLKAVRAAGIQSMLIAEKAGVTVLYGTDTFGGMHSFSTNEFVTRASALPAATVLKHATVNAAKALGQTGKLGRLVPGAFADLLLLSKNPLEDITILDEPDTYLKGIIKDGRCVKSHVKGLDVEICID